MPDQAGLSGLSQRLAAIVAGLLRAVGAQGMRNRALVPLFDLVWRRVTRLRNRFARLIALLLAGKLPRQHLPRHRPVAAADRTAPTPALRLPSGTFWLIEAVPYEAAGYGGQLQALMSDPAMQTLLASVPAAARILRPLCRLLGLHMGPPLGGARGVQSPQASRRRDKAGRFAQRSVEVAQGARAYVAPNSQVDLGFMRR